MAYATVEQDTTELIEEILALVRERLPAEQVETAARFVKHYYADTPGGDLAELDAATLYGAALAHWGLARERPPGVPKVHVYNPGIEQHGWQCPHTVIEVVTDDMPFLVDSLRMAITRQGLTCHRIIHPVMSVRRDPDGHLLAVVEGNAADADCITESVMHFEVDRQTEEETLEALLKDFRAVLGDVRAAVEDWQATRDRLSVILEEFQTAPPPLDAEDLAEVRAFLEWMRDDHFTFLGYRAYDLFEEEEGLQLGAVAGSGLGLLRDGSGSRSRSFAEMPETLRALAREPDPLILTKAAARATVHRPSHMDYIGIKRFDATGKVIGEHRFLGLYTATAYNRRPRGIPILRRKEARVLERAGFPRNSHGAKALIQVIETFPRDLLFQIDDDALYPIARGMLQLQERERIRVFIHRDRYCRFFSCIVYVPRDAFDTSVRRSIQQLLEDTLGGTDTELNVELSESTLARLYLVLRVAPDAQPEYDVAAIEAAIARLMRSWGDDLRDALLEHFGEERGARLLRRYGDAFRAGYREAYPARVAVYDVERMEALDTHSGIEMSLYRPLEADENVLRFKLYHPERPASLSDALPMLKNMGLRVEDERPYKIKRASGGRVWMHDFGMQHGFGPDLDIDRAKDAFQQSFARVWAGEVENDGFNRLVLGAGLEWREIVVLRAYCKCMRQAGVTFSQVYMEETLAANPSIARMLVELFEARFDPAKHDEARAERVVEAIFEALDQVAKLDQDRILRGFLAMIRATLRTNYYQRDVHGAAKRHLSFKLDPRAIPELPEPRPMYEIFVYSPRMEGLHLRGGPVAHGGIRWSDRPEDFRTEILGLMKAQMVKNAVIVPVGSKGGFVPKHLPVGDREAFMEEGRECYRILMRGLLDLTDNIVDGEIVPPADTVRCDGDDPYLVVAADKGTATFSDIANQISADYGFWLGDAFASGGSQGYDHKEMGITARGAWESVKRHFRGLGVNIQAQDFTAVGIGDMAGDVFGNGMLRSRHTRLIGAFNHMHVFLDPSPDPERSFAERERLFALPRSSWDDYDREAISKGGGVYPRSLKSIPLSPEVRAVLGVEEEAMPPNALIRALLSAPVDLLWNGGIGTYVKAAGERDTDVGDHANDGVRIDATALRCRVVGEGGNLGFTQLGRIEAARRGTLINTDAIDNSAGVDCSDHEVNIKILLNAVVASGDMTEKQRNTLLAGMTDEIASLVLRDNYLQTKALALAVTEAPAMLEVHSRQIRALERAGHIDRAVEFLPDAEMISERSAAGEGLASPELAVLIAYCKITLFHELVNSELPQDRYLAADLEAYFPTALRERFRERMPDHRLSREIIATVVANELVNRSGTTFEFRLTEETGATPADIVRAHIIAREVFDLRDVWSEIEALDNSVREAVLIRMLFEGRKLLERASRWLLRNRPRPLDIGAEIAYFRAGALELAASFPALLSGQTGATTDVLARELVKAGVSKALATRVAGFTDLYAALDLVEVGQTIGRPVAEVAEVYLRLGGELDMHWLRDRINALPRENRWQTLSRGALRDDLYAQERNLAANVLASSPAGMDARKQVSAWLKRHADGAGRVRAVMAELKAAGEVDFTMLSVAIREIRGLYQIAGGAAPVAPVALKSKRRKTKAG